MVTPPRFRIGVDENGMGPRLGPLLVTAVLAEATEKGHKHVERRARGAMKARVGDSKALIGHGDIALGEAWARVLAEVAGAPAGSPSELVSSLSADGLDELGRPCPDHVRPQCWDDAGEAFTAPGEMIRDVRRDLARLEKSGVRLVRAASVIVCTKKLNEAVDRGVSRFTVDLHAMERLVLGMRADVGEPVLAVCGKVGSLRQYEPVFGPLGGRPCTALEEKRHRSSYVFPGVGEIRFVMDADASDKLVSIASLVGKYLRDTLMARIVRHYRGQVRRELPEASGYYNPATTTFVEATALVRRRQKVPRDCFERRALEPAQPAAQP